MANKSIGNWAFLIGLIIAVLAGFINGYAAIVALVIFVLGLIVGLLNVTEKESASISALSMFGVVENYIIAILGNFVAFVGAAALVVAVKAIFETGKR